MPRGQGTGPRGMGAMTGRAAGFCAGHSRPGFANRNPGRGGGGCYRDQRRRCVGGRGQGQGRGNSAALPITGQAQGRYSLHNKAEILQAELNHLRAQLNELEP